MKKLLFVAVIAAVGLWGCKKGALGTSSLKTFEDSLSYSIGSNIRQSVEKDFPKIGVNINSGITCRAFMELADSTKSASMEAMVMQASKRLNDLMKAQKDKPVAPNATKSSNTDIPSSVTLKTLEDSISYFVGAFIRRNVKSANEQLGIKCVDELVCNGFMDGLDTTKMVLKPSAMGKLDAGAQSRVAKKQEEAKKKAEEAAKPNKEAGDKFLAENKVKPGVKTTASGLQYKVIKAGTGASPTKDDLVTVHYKGTLLNGKEFDSSYKRGEPAQFGVGGLIPGWIEALQMMKVGDKWELVVPTDLAYGMNASPEIGPNQTLIFEMELLGIKKDGAKQPAQQPGGGGGQQISPEQLEQLKKQMEQQQQQGGK